MRLLSTLLIITALTPLAAEDKTPTNVYRLDFTLRDSAQGQETKARHYSILLEANNWGKLVTGTKTPYTAEKDKYSFAEVGVTIRARVIERTAALSNNERSTNERMGLEAQFSVSSVVSGGNLPVIQEVRSEVGVSVVLGQSTMLAWLDDPKSEHHYDIDAVVTKI